MLPTKFNQQVRNAALRSSKILRMVPTSVADTSHKLRDYLIEKGILMIEDFDDFKEFGINMIGEENAPEKFHEEEIVSVSRRNSTTGIVLGLF